MGCRNRSGVQPCLENPLPLLLRTLENVNLLRISGSSGSGAPYAGIKKESYRYFRLIIAVTILGRGEYKTARGWIQQR